MNIPAFLKDIKERNVSRLFLDDVRFPYDRGWVIARDYDDFVDYIQQYGCPDVISFDHDLSLEHYPSTNPNDPGGQGIPYNLYKEKTGYHAAKWLIENGYCPKIVIVHSWNPAGAKNIAELFRDKCQCVVAPFLG